MPASTVAIGRRPVTVPTTITQVGELEGRWLHLRSRGCRVSDGEVAGVATRRYANHESSRARSKTTGSPLLGIEFLELLTARDDHGGG
jgi:hypothetical protein